MDGRRESSYLSTMAEAHFRPDPGMALATVSLETAASLEEIVSVLRRTGREIVGSDGIAVVLREGAVKLDEISEVLGVEVEHPQ